MVANAGHSTRCESAGGTAIFLPTRSLGSRMLALFLKKALFPALSKTTATIFRLAPFVIAVITVGASEMPTSACLRSIFFALSADPAPRTTLSSRSSCL